MLPTTTPPTDHFETPMAQDQAIRFASAVDRAGSMMVPTFSTELAPEANSGPGSFVSPHSTSVGVSAPVSTPHASEKDLRTQRQRLTLVRQYLQLLADLGSQNGAVRAMRSSGFKASLTNLRRWCEAYQKSGEAGLLPSWSNCGRAPACALTETEAMVLRGLILRTSTVKAIHFSLAVEDFANDPACQPLTRAYILAQLDHAAQIRRLPKWPPHWRKAAYPTAQEIAKFHGKKHEIRVGGVDLRGMFIVAADGSQIPIGPHTIWEMDDWSENMPRVTTCPDTGKAILTRQTLAAQDVYSAALLGFSQLARERDAYRIEDVADFVANSIAAHGMPDMLRLEKGKIWDGSFFHGFTPKIAGWPEDEAWGGLEPIIHVENVFTSKGKGGMEATFNLQQAIAAHAGLDIGRHRGDFEAAQNLLTKAKAGGELDGRFWSMERASEFMVAVCERFNTRPKQRHAFGKDVVVPNDLLRGARGRELPRDQAWRLLPVKKQAVVRGDHIEIKVDHYTMQFRFRVNGINGLHLDHGYQVLVAFHPGRPDIGCHIFNAELGARNRENFRRGEFLLVAPVANLVPQVDFSGKADFSARKKSSAAVTSNYRAVGNAYRATRVQNAEGQQIQRPVSPAPDSDPRLAAPQPDGGSAPAPVVPRRVTGPFAPQTADSFAAAAARARRIAAASQAADESPADH